jgi:hypothetical protein
VRIQEETKAGSRSEDRAHKSYFKSPGCSCSLWVPRVVLVVVWPCILVSPLLSMVPMEASDYERDRKS